MAASRSARQFSIRGGVQGVGFRPTAVRVAQALGLAGYVRNTRGGVELVVEGDSARVDRFLDELRRALSLPATIEGIESWDIPCAQLASFQIELDNPVDRSATIGESESAPNALLARIPADRRVCDACLAETRDSRERRHGYPFASCVECGPRYSLLERMPYERRHTTMRGFTSCSSCAAEEGDASDRRFHAQTLACAECGPRLEWKPSVAAVVTAESSGPASGDLRSNADRNAQAIEAACHALRQGQIVALRGLGGYQLLVDASNADAVARLRARKGRRDKPLALLVPSLDAARSLANFDDTTATALAGRVGPIVVAPLRSSSPISLDVTRGAETIGIMLPTTPLHALLADRVGICVATSGNFEGEPLAYEIADAEIELATIADGWLHHDRPIANPIDDSVIRVVAGESMTLRLARGLAPLPLPFDSLAHLARCDPHLALGGHQKSAVALWNGRQAVLGPHLGDLETAAARLRFAQHLVTLQRMYGVDRPRLVCDLHPDYASTRWGFQQYTTQNVDGDAAKRGASRNCEPFGVQHHEAHVAATMVEHELLDRPVLGVAWDGTGLGTDGTIWGGEFLVGRIGKWERRARWRPFPLLGGERAIREPWRVAAALLLDTFGVDERLRRTFLGDENLKRLRPLGAGDWPGVKTSSVGRLCDAVAVLLGGVERLASREVTFDGQLPMWLEDQAWRAAAPDDSLADVYSVALTESSDSSDFVELDWRPMVTQLVADRLADRPIEWIAAKFHRTLAAAMLGVADRFPALPIVVGGGVFQNRWLVEQLAAACATTGRRLYWPRRVPPNDGGLAVGQLALALVRQTESFPCA